MTVARLSSKYGSDSFLTFGKINQTEFAAHPSGPGLQVPETRNHDIRDPMFPGQREQVAVLRQRV
jgi:hypothetical protein